MQLVDLVVMNDGSTDDTKRNIQSRGIECLNHSQRSGVGASIRTVIHYAKKNKYDILVIMAGNGKDEPSEIPRLVKPITDEGFDFVQGSRYLPGGRYGRMPFWRLVATRWIHPWIFSWFIGRKMTDTTNGFRAIKLSVLNDKRIKLDQSWLNEYELEYYLLYQVIRLGYKIKDVPVSKIYPSRKQGYSKVRPITGWWSILRPIFFLGLRIKK